MQHVYPLGDVRKHLTEGDRECWCRPFEEDGVIIHRSADYREAFETRERKPS